METTGAFVYSDVPSSLNWLSIRLLIGTMQVRALPRAPCRELAQSEERRSDMPEADGSKPSFPTRYMGRVAERLKAADCNPAAHQRLVGSNPTTPTNDDPE